MFICLPYNCNGFKKFKRYHGKVKEVPRKLNEERLWKIDKTAKKRSGNGKTE